MEKWNFLNRSIKPKNHENGLALPVKALYNAVFGTTDTNRSGSYEGSSPTSLGPNLIAALASGSDTNSVGTWKLIKGKVSQTIEDIKSSKSSNQTITISKGETPHELDSDWETATIHSSISDELSLDQELKQSNKADSDSDNEYELINEPGIGDGEGARLRRSGHNVKSKIKTKSTASLQQAHHQKTQKPHSLSSSPNNPSVLSGGTMAAKNIKKDTSPSRSEGVATGSTRSSFLRRLKKQPPTGTVEPPQLQAHELDSSATVASKQERKFGVQAGRKETHEIESGVEMMEDMIVLAEADTTKPEQQDDTASVKPETENDKVVRISTPPEIGETLMENQTNIKSLLSRSITAVELSMHHIPFLTIGALAIVLMLPMQEFLRGVLACLLVTALLESTWASLLSFIEKYILRTMPERTKFKIPEFEVKSIFEVPAVEETKPTKTYSGWMNEVNSYDPVNFHISMAESVYIKLDGTMLRVSNTTARIPKRVTWNEKPIDRKSIQFTQHRTFDLLGCRIELLPVGLASKRFFNRKYPMQLIIKNPYDAKTGEKCPIQGAVASSAPSKESIKASIKRPSETENFYDVISMDSSTSPASNTTLTSGPSEMRADRAEYRSKELKQDFAATIMNADLRTLQNSRHSEADIKEISVPCGDETRILLFARADREKEDWFRRFLAASTGEINDQNLRLPNARFVEEVDLQEAAVKAALLITNPSVISEQPTTASIITTGENNPSGGTPEKEFQLSNEEEDANINENEAEVEENFEGLVMSSSAGRNPRDYIKFMALYQKSCNQTTIPVLKKKVEQKENLKRAARREKRHEENLWKGIDQSLFLGPSGSVVWFNVIAGRFIYSILSSSKLQKKIQEFFQKKLHTVKLPSFMEEVIITEIDMGDTPPLIHRVSQAMLDERGTWVDADVTYEGLLNFTVTTKLNLMRLKKQTRKPETTHVTVPAPGTGVLPVDDSENSMISIGMGHLGLSKSAIFDSDAESTGSSSSESEESDVASSYTSLSTGTGGIDSEETKNTEANVGQPQQPQPKKKPNKIFKIVDRFAASNFFQYATELPYVQRAMENMNANITLRLEVKGMVSRVVINLPPPPSDRLWIGFRGPPRLWIQAKPAFGDKTVDWSFLTSVIESKICEQINKILVYPNMVDITIAILGKSPFPEPGEEE